MHSRTCSTSAKPLLGVSSSSPLDAMQTSSAYMEKRKDADEIVIMCNKAVLTLSSKPWVHGSSVVCVSVQGLKSTALALPLC